MILPSALSLQRHERYTALDADAPVTLLGEGAFGKVFLAKDRATGVTVCIKKQRLPSASAAREFNTYCAMSHYPHPHVLRMLDSFTHTSAKSETLYMAFEKCDSTLWRAFRAQRGQPMSCERVAGYMAGAVLGLGHLHSLDIMHSDLSAGNLLVRENGQVVIADFGTSCSAHDLSIPLVGKTTIDVLPPEAWVHPRGASTSGADVWALGVVASTLLTGRRPWGWDGGQARAEDSFREHAPEVMIELLGRIDNHTWPDHSDCSGWLEFAKKYAAALGRAGESAFVSQERLALCTEYGGPLEGLVIEGSARHSVEFLGATLRWSPNERLGCVQLWVLPWFEKDRFVCSCQWCVSLCCCRNVWSTTQIAKFLLSAVGVCHVVRCRKVLSQERRSIAPGTEASVDEELGSESVHGAAIAGVLEDQVLETPATTNLGVGAAPSQDVVTPGASQRTPPGQVEAAAELGHCECSGNCGFPTCARNCNLRRRNASLAICTRAPLAGFRLCNFCKCETLGCSSPRNGRRVPLLRWCVSCGSVPLKTGQYQNALGVQTFERDWCDTLRVVARFGFLFQNYVVPGDITAFLELASSLSPRLGHDIHPQMLTALFLAQCVKWPPVVRFMQRYLHERDLLSFQWSDYHALVVACLAHAHQRPWKQMHSRMNAGIMHATTGLAMNASYLGIVAPKPMRIRKGACKRSETVYELGPKSKAYSPRTSPKSLATSQRVIENLMTEARAVHLAWPNVPADIPSFADSLVKFATAVRKFHHDGCGFPGGQNSQHVYHVKHFVRLMLLTSLSLMAQGRSQVSFLMEDDVFGRLPMSKVFEWTPLEDGDLRAAVERQSVAWVARKFAVNPLLLSCSLCLVGGMKDVQRGRAMNAELREVWVPVHQYYMNEIDNEDAFPPGVRQLFGEGATFSLVLSDRESECVHGYATSRPPPHLFVLSLVLFCFNTGCALAVLSHRSNSCSRSVECVLRVCSVCHACGRGALAATGGPKRKTR